MGTVDIVIGRVVGVHIADEVITDGKLDVRKTQPIARCGYYEYAVVRETFEMVIPGRMRRYWRDWRGVRRGVERWRMARWERKKKRRKRHDIMRYLSYSVSSQRMKLP